LQRRFSGEALLEAGVTVLDAHGRHALSSALSNSDSIVLAVRRSAQAPPYALAADTEIASATRWAFTAVLEDHRAKSFAEKFERRLFIVESMADVAVLWAMGFPAAPAHGLANMSRKRISEFCTVLGLARPDAATLAIAPRGLVLLPWSPARLDAAETPQFAAIRHHLGEIRQYLRIPLDKFGIWKPSDAELQRLQFCVERGAIDDVRNALLGSYEQCGVDLFDSRPTRPAVKPYVDSLRAWLAYQKVGGCDPYRRQQVWDRLLESLDCELILPLLRPVATGEKPATKLLRAQAAALGRLLLPQIHALETRSAHSLRERGAAANQVLPKEEVQQLTSLVDRFLAIYRDLKD
jgi:hypothetical protein